MKHIIIIFFLFISSLPAICQVNNLDEGNQCFNKGDYICAEAKYKEAFKTAVGKDKQIAEIKIQRANKCIEYLKSADLEFNNKNYIKAKEKYLLILESNSNDTYAKSQIENCNNLLIKATETSLSLSKTELSFQFSGGNETISIRTNTTTNINSYIITLLPSWCSVQKFNSYFVISCNTNYESTQRSDYFNISFGTKTIRVNIIQQGKPKAKDITLNVSNSNLYFTKNDDKEQTISITTNAVDFSVNSYPYWCIVKKYKDYITVSCVKNESNESRSNWFLIKAENKEVKVYINQAGTKEVSKEEKYKRPLTSFSSIGFQSGEIAKYGLIYEKGGEKFIGFHISIRSSLIPEEDIESGLIRENKTELDLGPSFKIFSRLYLNIGVGYGYFDYMNIDYYANTQKLEKMGYLVASSGLMFRISRLININGGVSFMDIAKDIYTPEITAGITFNLKK